MTTPDGLRGLTANEREMLAALAAKVASSDGSVSDAELRALTALGTELGQNMSEIARLARARYPDPEAALEGLGTLDESKLVQIREALKEVASADGSISPTERALLDAVGKVLSDNQLAESHRKFSQIWRDYLAAGSKRFSATHDDRYFREPEQVSRMNQQQALDEHAALLDRYGSKREGLERTVRDHIESGLPVEFVMFATLTVLCEKNELELELLASELLVARTAEREGALDRLHPRPDPALATRIAAKRAEIAQLRKTTFEMLGQVLVSVLAGPRVTPAKPSPSAG